MKTQFYCVLGGLMAGLDSGLTPGENRTFDLSEIPLTPFVQTARASTIAERPVEVDFYYHAGSLFRHDELLGNVFLAGAIHHLSEGKVTPDLPQMKEANTDPSQRTVELIRAKDLLGVFMDDVALFMFEGTDLDDGMLIELGFAKALGMPSVVVRTDFREAGDAGIGHDWNLMCDDWPAHKILGRLSIDDFAKALDGVTDPTDVSVRNAMYQSLARDVLEAFREVRAMEPVVQGTRGEVSFLFRSIIKSYDGSGHLQKLIDDDLLSAVIERKAAKGLIKIVEE